MDIPVKPASRDGIEATLGLLEADTWPPRHNVHKYWGKKPANVVRAYVEYFSQPGDTVLDPFCGSGVTPIEAALLGRHAVGFDFNPFAVALGRALAAPPEPRAFKQAAATILKRVEPEITALFHTACRDCGQSVMVRSFGYDQDRLTAIRYRCPCTRRSRSVPPDAADLRLAGLAVEPIPGTPDAPILFGWEMRKLKRRPTIQRWSDLFTPRNYRLAGALWREIQTFRSLPELYAWLSLTLTAGLAQFTRMIADSSGAGGGPSWKINSYWLPDKWQELNPHWYFENRAAKSLAGIVDLSSQDIAGQVEIRQGDSRSLPLADHSIDYIFTDPPYGGEGIQYGELSMLWNLWLGAEAPLEREIAFNPVRKLSERHYGAGLEAVFAEAARVLRPECWMTVTFANKAPQVWDALMGACRDAGFTLVTAAPMTRSAPSLTETTMRQAPKADLILSFQKTRRVTLGAAKDDTYHLERRIEKIMPAMRDAGIKISASAVFDRITIDWFSWFYENGRRPETVIPTLDEVEKVMSELLIPRIHHALQQGDLAAALAGCDNLDAAGNRAEASYLRGVVLCATGQYPAALAALERARQALPERADIAHDLGVTLRALDRIAEAATAWSDAVALAPDRAGSWLNLALATAQCLNTGAAETIYRQALAHHPSDRDLLYNLGNQLQRRGAYSEALPLLERLVEAHPAFGPGWINRGMALKSAGRFTEAEASYRRAIALADPACLALAWFNLGNLLLAEQRWEEGLFGYECRRLLPEAPQPPCPAPEWTVATPPGGTVLLWNDQGLGDAIQFLRHVPAMAKRGHAVTVMVPPQLARLAATAPGVGQVITLDALIGPVVAQVPLASLPLVLGLAPDAPCPAYLSCPDETAPPRRGGPRRIGLVWAGNPQHSNDSNRSIGLAALEPLLGCPNIAWVGLQQGPGHDQLAGSAFAGRLEDLGPDLADLAATARVIAGLDLVITVDTAVAHLAGALGRPAWVMLPVVDCDWRWGRSGERSRLYPSLRLLRQEHPGQWDKVVAAMVAALSQPTEPPI